jgi:hypothetical protein
MLMLFTATVIALAVAGLGILFVIRLRLMQAAATSQGTTILVGRYRPMLRLLADDDFRLLSATPALRKTLRAERCRLFRAYLRCLARDYGSLLAGIRHVMIQSGIDRPDLAHLLMQSRLTFALALCKAEIRVALFAAGIGRVDVSGLVGALESLRAQAGTLQTAVASR